MESFPVESILPAVRDSLARNRTVVLRAPPGSGKTTCVPPYLLDAPFLEGRKIVMLEPRRLAARSSAQYMARQRGEAVGETVGFQVRLERKVSARTRLEIVTEGLLAQRLLNDPELADTGLLIFDEFHERSLACDLGFALALDVRRALRPDLRIVVMSATLDVEAIAAHLGDADVHTAQARMYPVETRYLHQPSGAPVADQMAGAVARALAEPGGDVLCFLPGEGEIRRCQEAVEAACEARRVREADGRRVEVRPLYGALPKEQQDDVVAPRGAAAWSAEAPRRVILATSIAETSLTIDGVTTVIDSGLMRVSRFSPRSGMNRLETLRVTRDRAEQRRGRAGRVRPGVCMRLWTEAEDRLLAPSAKPEIEEADLTPTALAVATWGTTSAEGLPWLTPPPAANWGVALEVLRLLGALDRAGRLTDHGRDLARVPVHPRYANMICRTGSSTACLAAAALEELPNGGPRRETDLRRVLDLVRERPNDRFSHRVRTLAARWARYAAAGRDLPADRVGELLCFAFPDRIAHNRGNGTFQMTCGRGAFLPRTDALAAAPYLVLCDLDDAGGDATVRLAAPVDEEALEELFADEIEETVQTTWDRRAEAVKAVKVRGLWKMMMRAGGQSEPDDAAVAAALVEGIRQKGVAQLPWTPVTRQLQARILFLHRVLGEPWPDVSDGALTANLTEWLTPFVSGMNRWAHVQRLDLAAVLDSVLGAAGLDRRTLDRLAPVKMTVPSGSQMTIHYEEAEPFVAARLQECFGLQETPKVAGGTVPVVMRLLSPAQRPVQITKDLAGFWKSGYALVRKDLRGRYPKHYWPEDPSQAVATRRVRPPNVL